MPNRSKIVAIVLLLAIGAICLYYFTNTAQEAAQPAESLQSAMTESEEAQNNAEETEIAQEETIPEEEFVEVDAPIASQSTATIDVAAALKERRIGDPNAPVTIREYASLTCGHCAHFHKTIFQQLEIQSINTGNASLIFTDFPLNKPALDASMVARCLPEGRYFSFLSLLFETQDDWAFDANYMKYLKQNAQLAGLSAAQFDACVNNEELRDGILARMKSEQEKYEINSTPTFAIGETVIRGALPLASFTKTIDDQIKAKEAPQTEPSTE